MTVGSGKFRLFISFHGRILYHINTSPYTRKEYRLYCCDSLAVCVWILALSNKWYEFPPFILQDYTTTFFS